MIAKTEPALSSIKVALVWEWQLFHVAVDVVAQSCGKLNGVGGDELHFANLRALSEQGESL